MDEIDSLGQAITEIQARLGEASQSLAARRGRMEGLLETRARRVAARDELLTQAELLEEVRALLQRVAEYAREQARQQIEMLVTQMLQYVFGADLEFRIDVQEVKGKPEAEFYVVSRYGNVDIVTRPQDARGGGIVDVVSLALRLAMVQTCEPAIDGPIVMDEPAKHVSDEYIGNVAEFLKQMSEAFGRQVIMVTHNQQLAEIADRAYHVEMREGKSRVASQTVSRQPPEGAG